MVNGGLGIRWTTGQGVKAAEQKQTLLLHCADLAVREIFYTMIIAAPEEGQTV